MKTLKANLRINILGAKGVGKSAITVRYLTGRFIGEYSSGCDITYQTTFTHEDTNMKIDINDTTSQNANQPRWLDVYNADGFVVVYSVTDQDSLMFAKRIIETIRSKISCLSPILLLGNKLDLDHAREVSPGDVDKLREIRGCQHMQVSAAECPQLIITTFQGLLMGVFSSSQDRVNTPKPKTSLLKNVSRKFVNVFRRTSLEDSPKAKRKVTAFSYHSASRRSV